MMRLMDASESKKMLLFPFFCSPAEEEEVVDQAADVTEEEEEEEPAAASSRKLLSKQLSMRETTREAKWEKRRRQILDRRRRMAMEGPEEEPEAEEGRGRGRVRSLTDEDLDELRGSIELGFGFNEEDGGHALRDTLPALDLYFAVNRQLSDPKLRPSPSPVETPTAASPSGPSPRSPDEQRSSNAASDSWKICSPGDDPQHVKMRLRQWAQVVACSVRQCC